MVARLVLLDTNVLIDLLEGAPRARLTRNFLESLGKDILLGYSLITRFELLAIPDVARTQVALDLLEHITPFDVSTRVVDRAAQIFRTRYAHQRRKIPDALIAATAIEHGAELMTHDETDFTRIPELRLLKPKSQST
jgi:predicted nucleic acid-binding protein